VSEVAFREVREPHTGKLLCRVDVERELVEIQRRGIKVLIDLAEMRRGSNQALDNTAEGVLISTY
jgi:hypothetical protein